MALTPHNSEVSANTSSSRVLTLCSVAVQNEGVRGFYKGLGPALLRVMPQVCAH